MTDVLERLRAANPVSDCALPDLDGVLRRLNDGSGSVVPPDGSTSAVPPGHDMDAGARTWRDIARPTGFLRAVTIVAALGAALAVFTVLGHSGGGISLVQRAYAATDPAGGIVHYVWSSRSLSGSGAGPSHVESQTQEWLSGSRSRRVETTVIHLRNGRVRRGVYEQINERIPRGETTISYSSWTHTIFKGLLRFTGRVAPGSASCIFDPVCSLTAEDPVLALRKLYAAGRVHEVGHARLNGKTLTVLGVETRPAPAKLSRSISQRILVDPKTGDPVELVTQYGRYPRALTSTTTFHTYQHLVLTPQTERLLVIRAHPHARVECVPALHCSAK
jgi:hypothetical protein